MEKNRTNILVDNALSDPEIVLDVILAMVGGDDSKFRKNQVKDISPCNDIFM